MPNTHLLGVVEAPRRRLALANGIIVISLCVITYTTTTTTTHNNDNNNQQHIIIVIMININIMSYLLYHHCYF